VQKWITTLYRIEQLCGSFLFHAIEIQQIGQFAGGQTVRITISSSSISISAAV
jgi:hypothetical protein